MRRIHSTISVVALATATLFAVPAAAQATAEPTDPVATDAGADLGDIVVTAQRKSESLKEVPLSVSKIDDSTLAAINSGGADIRALAGHAPGLNIESSYGRTFPRFYIRGLGNTDFDLNASQPVSLVYDDVVLENPILKGFPIFDMAGVEVLRGPQGTLFGRNTPAGIVKFDSVRPGKGQSYARVSYGTYNTINAEGALDAKLGDTLGLRVSGLWQHRDDWVDNVMTSKKNDFEGFNDRALRAQLQWKPDNQFTALLTGQLRDYKGSARLFRANLFAVGSNDLIGLDGPGSKFNIRKVATDGINFQKAKTQNVALNLSYDFGPATLYSVSSYWHGRYSSRGDVDGGFGCSFCGAGFTDNSYPGFIPFAAQSQDDIPSLKQLTQEIRVASNNKLGLGYQAGIFLFNERLHVESFDFGSPTDTTPDAIATQYQKSNALGIFGSVNYKTEGGLTLQAGARWNHDKKHFVGGRPYDTRPPFLSSGPIDPPLTEDVKANALTWDVSADQRVNEQVNVYARVARGYRAPSVQGRLSFGDSLSTAKPEFTLSYEAGVKTSFLDNKAHFNLAAYYFDTKDLQLTAVGGTSNFTTLLNAAHVRGHGFEAEFDVRPVKGLKLAAGFAYNPTKIHDKDLYVAGCGAGCTVLDPVRVGSPGIYSIDGNQLPQAPKWTANWNAGYEVPVGNGAVYAYTDWTYRSRIQFFLYNSVEFSSDHDLEGGLRVGYKTDRFDIAAFGRNITNQHVAVSGIDFNNLTGMVNEPRILGIEAGVKF